MNPGDEVLYPSPGYPIYESQIEFLGGVGAVIFVNFLYPFFYSFFLLFYFVYLKVVVVKSVLVWISLILVLQ
jgi:hypothetical protein